MNKKIFVSVLIAFLMLAFGCTTTGTSSGDPDCGAAASTPTPTLHSPGSMHRSPDRSRWCARPEACWCSRP